RNDDCYAHWIRRDFHIDPGCRHNFRNDTSGRIGHYGRCALRRSRGHFRGLRICAAQLREPEHRAETRSGTGCSLLRPVDYHRNSHRSYLQTPRYTIIVKISVYTELAPDKWWKWFSYPKFSCQDRFNFLLVCSCDSRVDFPRYFLSLERCRPNYVSTVDGWKTGPQDSSR